MNMNLSYDPPHMQCAYNHSRVQAVLTSCPLDVLPSYNVLEILITVNFPKVPNDFRVYLGMTNSRGDILAHAEPIGLGPGSNFHGLSSISIKQRLSGKAAAIGIPKYRRFPVINVHSLSPDWLASLPRGNSTATLRVTIRPQPDIEIEQEYLEGSVLTGFALVCGVWTLINGLFAAIFGTTLLLVLFGIKPLSIYGLIHHFRPGKGTLVDRDYVLPPEGRDRTVGILREYLLDVDDIEEGRTSSPRYNSMSVEP